MKTKILKGLLPVLCAAIVACGGGEESAGKKTGDTKPAKSAEAKAQPAAAEGETDGGHEHGTVQHELGSQSAGAWSLTAQQADDVMPGHETVFYVNTTGAPKPSAVRLWVGDESASNSIKILGEWIDDTRAHAHVEIPNPLAAGDKFWVELEGDGAAGVKASFDLAKGTVLPTMGPNTGFVVPLVGATGFAELKLHDDKGDLELWLAQDAAITQPLDLPLDAVITVSFPDLNKSAELRVRNTDRNEDEEGESNVRDGKTNYFIFPGATGADPTWLMGDFRSTATIQFAADGASVSVAPFTLVPHTHGPGEHTH